MLWYATNEGDLINLERFDMIKLCIKKRITIEAVIFNDDEHIDTRIVLFEGTEDECKEELERIKKNIFILMMEG